MRTALLAIGVLVSAQACGNAPEGLREWQPSDHQPPPAQAPEGQGSGDEAGSEASAERAAAALWGMRCARCHGTAGRGDGGERPPGIPMPDLTSASQDKYTDEQLAEVIVKGRGMMPAFGNDLTDSGVAALVKHVRTLRAR